MADLREGSHSLRFGNYWDFHAGCCGAKMIFADGSVMDFSKEWTNEIRRPLSVAEMVAKKIGAEVIVKKRKTPFDC